MGIIGHSDSVLLTTEVPWWWVLQDLLTPGVIIALLIVASIVLLAVVVGGLLAYRRLRRSPLVSEALLTYRAEYASAGPRQEVARLRLRLAKTVASARTALTTLDARGAYRGELPSLVRRLEGTASALDAQLRLIESETDADEVGSSLPAARARVDEVAGIVRHIRQAAAAQFSGETASTLDALTADVDHEVRALQAGVDMLRALSAGAPMNPGGR